MHDQCLVIINTVGNDFKGLYPGMPEHGEAMPRLAVQKTSMHIFCMNSFTHVRVQVVHVPGTALVCMDRPLILLKIKYFRDSLNRNM